MRQYKLDEWWPKAVRYPHVVHVRVCRLLQIGFPESFPCVLTSRTDHEETYECIFVGDSASACLSRFVQYHKFNRPAPESFMIKMNLLRGTSFFVERPERDGHFTLRIPSFGEGAYFTSESLDVAYDMFSEWTGR